VRFRDLLTEHSMHDRVVHELLDQMAVYVGTKQHEVPIDTLIRAMQDIDLDADKDIVVAVLKDKPFIGRITNDTIYFKVDDSEESGNAEDIVDNTDDTEQNQQHVEKMAQRAIKSRNK